jgi:hypothetical protein
VVRFDQINAPPLQSVKDRVHPLEHRHRDDTDHN